MTARLPSSPRLIIINDTDLQRRYHLQAIIETYQPVYINMRLQVDIHHIIFTDHAYILLDECDYVADNDLSQILYYLLDVTTAQIIINGRDVPVCIYRDKHLRHHALFYPTYHHPRDKVVLQAQGFGQGYISVDMLSKPEHAGQLPFIMLFYLLENKTISVSQTDAQHWLDKPEATSGNLFQVTKKDLHDIFLRELIVHESRTFYLSPQLEITYDVAEFEALVQAYYQQKDIDLLYTAIQYYQGDFLIGIALSWVQKRRNALRQMYHDVLLILAKYHLYHHDDAGAVGFLTRILRDAPHREDVSYLLMKIYIRLTLIHDAYHVYQRLVNALSACDMQPSAKIRELAKRNGFDTDANHTG